MRILHTNFHRGWGGQSNRILTVCRKLSEKGHAVTIAAPPGSILLERARSDGLGIFDGAQFISGFRPLAILRDIRTLRSLITKEGFHIVHTHGSQDSWATAFVLIGLRPRPLFIRTKHNIFPIRDHIANRWLYGKAIDKIVCISNAILTYCAAKPYIRQENLALIHSAVNAEYYGSGDGEKVRSELGITGRFVTGITGRLREEKGHRTLFQAIARIKDAAKDLILVVSGTGSMYGELTAYARNLGISDRVFFTGFRADIPDVLASFDLFVMPSISEGLGTAVLEAAAAGLPIIASNVGGIPDIIKDGERGILVAPGDADALAKAILFLYKNRPIAQTYAGVVRQYVRENFSENTLAEKTEALYRKATAHS